MKALIKSTIIIAFCIFYSASNYAQKLNFYGINLYGKEQNDKKNDKFSEIQSKTLHVILTGNNEIDEQIKMGFDKYWKVGKVQYDKKQTGMIDFYCNLSNYTTDNALSLSAKKSYSKIEIAYRYNKNYYGIVSSISFDDMRKSDKIIGIDKDKDFIKARIIQYIMFMNSEFNRIKDMEMKESVSFKGWTKKLKGKTILVQKEYFDKEIESNVLNDLSFKVKILPTSEIKEIVDTQKDTENLAQLMLVSNLDEISAYIIDLKTGDLLNSAKIEKSVPDTDYLTTKTLKKLVKEMNANMK